MIESNSMTKCGTIIKRIVYSILLLAVITLIFAMSSEDIPASRARSGTVVTFIVQKLILQPEKLNDAAFIGWMNNFVRKSAHFLIYLTLGFMMAQTLSAWFPGLRRKEILLYLLALFMCAAYAASDEVHQIFTLRGAMVQDVLLDSAGSALGVWVAFSAWRPERFKKFILPACTALLFVFGQIFFLDYVKMYFRISLAYPYLLISIFLVVLNFGFIPLRLAVTYTILFAYSFVAAYMGGDLFNGMNTVMVLSAVFAFSAVKFKESDISAGFLLSGIFSIYILDLYNRMSALSYWNSNSLGQFITFSIMGLIITLVMSKNIAVRLAALALAGISIYQLYFTRSRTGVVSLTVFILIVTVFYFLLKKKIFYRLFYAVCLSAPLVISRTYNLLLNNESLADVLKYSKLIFGKGTLFSERNLLWDTCEKLIGSNWLFGHGKSIGLILYTHNLFYSIIYMYGLVGFIIYNVLMVMIFEYVLRSKDKMALICAAAFGAICLQQSTEAFLFGANSFIFMPYVFLAIAISRAYLIGHPVGALFKSQPVVKRLG